MFTAKTNHSSLHISSDKGKEGKQLPNKANEKELIAKNKSVHNVDN